MSQLRYRVNQTDSLYRQTIENRVQSVWQTYSHPDIVSVIHSARSRYAPTSLSLPFAPFIDNPLKGYSRLDSHLLLDVDVISRRRKGFFIAVDLDQRQEELWAQTHPRKRRVKNPTEIALLDELLSLDSITRWEALSSPPEHKETWKRYWKTFRKLLTVQDFVNHPEWLEALEGALYNGVNDVYFSVAEQLQQGERRLDRFSGIPLGQVLQDLRANTHSYSSRELLLVAQDAAETALENTPSLPTGIPEEQIRIIVAQMIEDRLISLQAAPERQVVSLPSPQIEQAMHQLAQGDPVAESLMRRFVRRSRDPQRVTQAFLAFSGVIPGVDKLRALLETINIMFGPEETTR